MRWEKTDQDIMAALLLSPHKSNADAEMIATPMATKPTVTSTSCQGAALWPAPVIGDSAAVPKMAAIVVTAQLPYVPPSNAQYATMLARGDKRTSFQTEPKASRKVPFITPSRWAARAIRVFTKCCWARPVKSPIKNKAMPCQRSRRLYSTMSPFEHEIIFLPATTSMADHPPKCSCAVTLSDGFACMHSH